MVILCKSNEGLRFVLLVDLLTIYLFAISKIERWQKQHLRSFKTVNILARGRLFLY